MKTKPESYDSLKCKSTYDSTDGTLIFTGLFRNHSYYVKKAACRTNLDDKWKELRREMVNGREYAEARRCESCKVPGQDPVWGVS